MVYNKTEKSKGLKKFWVLAVALEAHGARTYLIVWVDTGQREVQVKGNPIKKKVGVGWIKEEKHKQ